MGKASWPIPVAARGLGYIDQETVEASRPSPGELFRTIVYISSARYRKPVRHRSEKSKLSLGKLPCSF